MIIPKKTNLRRYTNNPLELVRKTYQIIWPIEDKL
jgi:hypothetical protein